VAAPLLKFKQASSGGGYITPDPLINDKTLVFVESGWNSYGATDYARYYQTAALVGGAMTMQYIGRLEYEGGVWVSSHLQNIPIDLVTTDDIENG
jgi:hypothetical protein